MCQDKSFFYQNRITQSDYRGGKTKGPRGTHAMSLAVKMPKVTFKTDKGKQTFLTILSDYVGHFSEVLLGETYAKTVNEKLFRKVKSCLGI